MALLDEVTRLGTGAATASAAKRKTANTLDITDFLRLMTTQLKNQDPLKPLDSTEFVAQLAQFGTVSGIQGMADTLGTLSTALRSSQALSGASLVGHQVLAQGTSATFRPKTLLAPVSWFCGRYTNTPCRRSMVQPVKQRAASKTCSCV